MRVYELARKYKLSSEEMVQLLQELQYAVNTHMAATTEEMAAAVAGHFSKKAKPAAPGKAAVAGKPGAVGKPQAVPQAPAAPEAPEQDGTKRRATGQLKTNLQSRLDLVKKRLQMKEEMDRQKQEMLKHVVSAPERKTDPIRVAEAPAERIAEPERPAPPIEAPHEAATAEAKVETKPAAAAPGAQPEAPKEAVRARIREGELFRPKLVTAAPGKQPEPAKAAAPATASEPKKPSVQTLLEAEGLKKRRRKKKKTREVSVDRKAVEATLKKTIAAMDGSKKKRRRREQEEGGDEFVAPSKEIVVSEFLTVAELANQLDRRPSEVVAKLMELGQMATINQRLDFETIETVALEFDYGVRMAEDEALDASEETDEAESLKPRPPVVTIMGHVDHGKTKLLDYIRKSNVIAGEAGGITQHIGAYNVATKDGGRVTFLDTPGHEAFSAMRARGAQVTDCVVLVVSAVESVMPQTVEAIDHAKAAGVPIIVAINKIDLPDSNPDKVRQQLTEYGLVPEEWGGNTIMVNISAKMGDGVDKLLEMIALQTELLELKANPDRLALGRVIEAELDKGKGPVVNALIQRGTLRVGDPIVVGPYMGRVRAMLDEREKRLTEAGPATAVQLLGVSGVPQAGDSIVAYGSESEAQRVAQQRAAIKREQDIRHKAGATVGDWARRIAEGEIKELKLIIKGDVDGSVEALSDTLERIEHPEVKVNVIHRGVGRPNESDVLLAAASEAMIVAFHVVPDAIARETAAREHVAIREYDIIYEAEQEIKKLLEGMLGMDVHEEVAARVEVRELFKVPKVGTVAGCYVLEGAVKRGGRVRIVREGRILNTDTVATLRRFKDDAREVSAGYECGIKLANFSDLKVGDQFEMLEEVQVARTLA
jgi:translation initiation factor IF-2